MVIPNFSKRTLYDVDVPNSSGQVKLIAKPVTPADRYLFTELIFSSQITEASS
jgi:hypothetical protein